MAWWCTALLSAAVVLGCKVATVFTVALHSNSIFWYELFMQSKAWHKSAKNVDDWMFYIYQSWENQENEGTIQMRANLTHFDARFCTFQKLDKQLQLVSCLDSSKVIKAGYHLTFFKSSVNRTLEFWITEYQYSYKHDILQNPVSLNNIKCWTSNVWMECSVS